MWLLVRKRIIPTVRPPRLAKQCRLLRLEGVARSKQRILSVVIVGFLDWSRYFVFQVAPQLPSRCCVDLVPNQ
jgi:hypothetical protein